MSQATLTHFSSETVGKEARHTRTRRTASHGVLHRAVRASGRSLLSGLMRVAWLILFLMPVAALLLSWWLGLA